ncbi:hemerythrin domain-containing protein [Thiohalorhabdus methylotrophus]|uniref:Hemerythrin domain-containing protein n=1 Tax=Thiohalorhabdus methylotrophus TaxID=3242694 RepID=A0ABV4TT20_9GAMM
MPLEADSAPDFQSPLQLLRACHQRIERFADLAVRIAEHLPGDDPPAEPVRQSAGQVLRYFDQAAPLHHADEEEDLLPRLRGRLVAEPDPDLSALLDGLKAEHAGLENHWGTLRPLLDDLREGEPVEAARYRASAEAFRDAQLDHLQRENAHLLPAAEATLREEDIRDLGAAMAQRRGVRQNI